MSSIFTRLPSETSTSSFISSAGDTRTIIVLTWSAFILASLIFVLVYTGSALKHDIIKSQILNETPLHELYGAYSAVGAGLNSRQRDLQTGPCADINEQKFLAYFDYELNLCSRFVGDLRYCLVGDNRFETRDDCRRACISPAFQKHRCKEVRFGFCLGPNDRVYNVVFSNGQCRLTKSILCLQGDNKFLNLEECQKFCCKTCNSEHCLAPPREGQCLSADLRYRFYFDNSTNQCLVHRGVCLKGRNRYRTLETCAAHFPLKSEDRLRCVRTS
ncbi:papilin-like [Dermacentor variabilis]|uniref:papilin-like n=1 Tax=Dermacentor variabilis TaxID=34621 RepID=UPI003F5B3E4F